MKRGLSFPPLRVFRVAMSSGPVAVIDIGSNSIKILVARRAADGEIVALHTRTLDARISAGLSQAEPRLGAEGMARGLAAIQTLLADARLYAVDRSVLVATSAVRSARNGGEFTAAVRAATGHAIRILSGDEEANLIGRGLTCDPALRHLRDFHLFDLGGGSLECLAFRERQVQQAISLPLGCVRLTERFVSDPAQPLPPDAEKNIAAHVREQLDRSGFALPAVPDAIAVGTGGTVSTARAILGARQDNPLDATSPVVAVSQLRELVAGVGSLPLARRREVRGLPAARADVFPAALVTLLAVAEAGGFSAYHHSLYNLRYGVAAELLGLG